MPNYLTYGDTGWNGLDLYHDPKDVPEGFLTACDNLSVNAGRLVVRPGKQGQLSSALTGANYRPVPITQSDGTTHFWFANGTTLQKWVPGNTSTSTLTFSGMPSLTASSVSICQAAGYVYVADTASGLMRFLPDGTTGTAGGLVTGLSQPNAPSSVKLSHQSLLPVPGQLAWVTYDANTPTVSLISGGNNTPTAANTDTGASKYWTATSLTDVYFSTFTDSSACVFVGGTPISTYFQTRDRIALTAGSDNTYPTAFRVTYIGQTKTGGDATTSRIQITLYLYDSSNVLIDSRSILVGLMNTTPSPYSCTFDCRDAASDIYSIRVRFADANSGIAGDDPGLQNINIYPAGYGFTVPAAASGSNPAILTVRSGTVYASPVGNVCADGSDKFAIPLPQTTSFYTRGRRFHTVLGATTDLSQVERISARVKLLFNTGDPAITVPVRLFIENTAGSSVGAATSRAYSAQSELSTGTVVDMDFDLTTSDLAIRSAVTRIGIEFADDVSIPDQGAYYPPTSGGGVNLLEVDFFTKPGNLTPGTSITYLVVEWDTRTDYANLQNVIQSDGSVQSGAIIPTLTDAIGVITLAAKVNNGAGLFSTYFAIYRFGDYTDGFGRLLCLLPWSTFDGTTHLPTSTPPSNIAAPNDANKGTAPYYAAPGNPYIDVTFPGTVGAAGIVITDNTPSSWLFNASNYVGGRDKAPSLIRDIVVYQNRLCLLCGNSTNARRSEFYMSWLLSADSNAGLYWSRTVDPTDVNAAVKGFYVHLATEDNDRAIRMMSLEDRAVFLFERKAPFLLIGTDPSNYSIRPFTGESSALGLAARDAALLFNGSLIYLTTNGLVRWNTYQPPQPFSLPIRGYLNPNLSIGGGTAIPAAYYGLCSLWQHGDRLYLASPAVSTDTANTVIYRFDPKEGSDTGVLSGDGVAGAWTRWKQGNVTQGAAAVGASDTNGHYVFGLDGQIYLYVVGAGDKATSGASITGIAFAMTTRGYGHDQNGFNLKIPFRIDTEFTSSSTEAAGIAVTVTVFGDRSPLIATQAYNLALLDVPQNWSFEPDYAEGKILQVGASATVKKPFVIGPLRMQAKVGSDWQQY